MTPYFNCLRGLRKSTICIVAVALLVTFIGGCAEQEPEGAAISTSEVRHPEWSRNLSIYEVNLRQYSDEGTFTAFARHLPRLKEMGVGILWFMPIHPIGEKNRKGTLGSYYAVKDYMAVNPEFGALEDFRRVVAEAHEMGMYVILDWVANHTAWDNPLTQSHPEWYTKNEDGEFVPPVPDWSDVIDLNYDQRGLWDYQMKALKYWVEQADIDGYRCDVAGMVPMAFWEEARAELQKLKPVFMLAEAEGPEFHEKAFDMTYAWDTHHLMNEIAQGRRDVTSLDLLLEHERETYPRSAYRMQFTSNHDENTWNGTVFERLGEAAEAFAVLTATMEGMPLVYSGQEAGLDKRLAFFEKDVIAWREHEFAELYTTLIHLKLENQALWNGEHGGALIPVRSSNEQAIFAFRRQAGSDRVFTVLNLSDTAKSATFSDSLPTGDFREVFSDDSVALGPDLVLDLEPWGYRVFVE